MEDVGRPLLEPRLEHLIMIKIAGLDEIADFGTGLRDCGLPGIDRRRICVSRPLLRKAARPLG